MDEKKFFLAQSFLSFGLVFLALTFLTGISLAQTTAPPNIFRDSVYSSVKVDSNIQYGVNFNHFFNETETLLLDTYEPNATVDYHRPLIIYCHGGGFTAGDKVGDHAIVFGNYFAKRGYVMASINYRLAKENPADTIDNYEGVYQATQDAKSAVRFFKHYAENYCLDTSAFFMIGTSSAETFFTPSPRPASMVRVSRTSFINPWGSTLAA